LIGAPPRAAAASSEPASAAAAEYFGRFRAEAENRIYAVG